ncbi:DNA-directed RNA polymerase subunit 2 [Moumouvirus goulette]|uniref:DNA-directed RNA polymerase subunit beta n=1 Tax=Moumouvirus goulette TaxID=1247379 RepID=M1NN67_9VIRU|nr:DNA-directed RNA polymerase subunit 2 [Moumouvirus goulette]AGF85485.1 DNA-directed RNA polymerase subunit 2 [Moumouvirus goulette]
MSKKSKEVEDVNSNYDSEPFFGLLDLFFERNNQILVSHHIESFNQLIEETIPSILRGGDNIISEKTTENKVIRYRLTFDDLGIKPPSLDNDEGLLYPLDAIRKQLSYSSKYTATITQWQDIVDISTGKTETRVIGAPEKDVPIAKIPIMVKSKYCNLTLRPDLSCKHCRYDQGGYFIVNGSEKVVLSVESMIRRKPMVFTQKDQNSLIYYVRVLSQPATQLVGNAQTFTIRMKKDNSIVLTVPYFKDVSIFTLIRALGIENDEDIVDAILNVRREKDLLNQLSISMNSQNSPSLTREEAMEKMIESLKSTKNYGDANPEVRAQQKRKYVEKIMTQYILPHVNSGTNDPNIDMIYKAYYICYMVHKLLKCFVRGSREVEEFRGCDDRDSMTNKRIDLTGTLLGSLFKQFYDKMINDCNKIFRTKNADDKKPPNIIPHIKANTIEQGLRQALSTGVFGSQARKGLSQMLNRMNHLHSSSYLRRVITPTVDASTNKMTSPRHLHNTQYGSMDPLETPEGPKTGIVKNMTMMESITISMNSQIPIIENYLSGKITPLESVNRKKIHTHVKVFLNGNWLGVTDNIIKIHSDLRNMRFKGELHKHVSFDLNFRLAEFNIYTDGGRLIRPYLTVTDNKLNFKPEMLDEVSSWDEFIAKFPDVIEYVDKEEEQNMMLAVFPQYIEDARKLMMKKSLKNAKDIDKVNHTNRYDGHVYQRYTHCEIHPCMILGLISSNIPFPDHNQSPRGIFQYNQARQAMGLYISDYRERTDISYILYHTQIPLVTSRASKYTGTHIFPAGENSIVAIASIVNQEDSLLMNESAIQKGFMRAQALKKYFETIKKNPASSQTGIFMKPDPNKVDNLKDANYDKLSEEGYAKVETVIRDGDVIIGMVNPKPTTREDEKPYKDSSTIYKSLVPGAIDKVITEVNNDGYPIIKIRVRSERIPAVGDKFSSRAGQKGTVGFKIHRADMPFTKSGLVPDIIINPNCMPKRMTIGQLIECLLGKVCAIKGVYGDATPFTGVDINKINDELVSYGYEAWGNETMTNGMTGEKMHVKIFIGPTYYQRLKQMVGDKTHSRARGPTQLLTRRKAASVMSKTWLVCRCAGNTFKLRGQLKILIKKLVKQMERDAICAHGLAQFLKERLVDNSDIYTAYVCDNCGMFAHKVPDKKYYTCTGCQNSTSISKVVIPYAFKLLMQELASINILGRIRTSKSIITPKN